LASGEPEVDFVVERAGELLAVEVKSGRRRDGLPGVGAFLARGRCWWARAA